MAAPINAFDAEEAEYQADLCREAEERSRAPMSDREEENRRADFEERERLEPIRRAFRQDPE